MAVDNNSVKAMKKYSELLVNGDSLKKDTIKDSYYSQIITESVKQIHHFWQCFNENERLWNGFFPVTISYIIIPNA